MEGNSLTTGYGALFFIVLPAGLLMFFMMAVFFALYIRIKAKDAILVRLWGVSKFEKTMLIKLKGKDFWYLLKDETDPKNKKFIVDPTFQHFCSWPGGMPGFMQTTLPTYYYRDDQSEPLDPRGLKMARVISPEMLNAMTNDAVMEASMRDARLAAEGQLTGMRGTPTLILIGVAVTLVVGIIGAVLSYMSFKDLKEVVDILTGQKG